MVSSALILLAFAAMLLILVVIPPSLEKHEREATIFVAGVFLIMLGLTLPGLVPVTELVGTGVVLLGVLLILASVVPLLRKQPDTA